MKLPSKPLASPTAESALGGKRYWRTLGELVDARAAYGAEVPHGDVPLPGLTRRSWLEITAASLALASMAGCSREERRKLLPYTIDPVELTPGQPNYYATSLCRDGYSLGVIATCHEGRPTKIEGNPEHPMTLGAAGIREQASVFGLYDPHRTDAIVSAGGPATWEAVVREFGGPREDKGKGLRFVMEPATSPLVGSLIERVMARFPEARFVIAGSSAQGAAAGVRLAFGREGQPRYDLSQARVILALDADFLATMPSSLAWARQFADGRRVTTPGEAMNRLYAVEGVVTSTGTTADHRLRRRSGLIAPLGMAIAAKVLAAKTPGWLDPGALSSLTQVKVDEADARFVDVVAKDLLRAGDGAVMIVGERQPDVLHAVGCLVNRALESKCTSVANPIELRGNASFEQLVAELRAGAVDTLILLADNPVYTAPAELDLGTLVKKAKRSLHFTMHNNETSACVGWVVPAVHDLESWADGRGGDGTVSFAQPVISPLFAGKQLSQLLALFAGQGDADPMELLRDYWTSGRPEGGLPLVEWEKSLRRGVLSGSAAAPLEDDPAPATLADEIRKLAAVPPVTGLEATFVLDTKVGDGRYANNPWLQELPDPITKLTWDNAALMSPKTAEALGIKDEDVVRLELRGRSVEAPVLRVPGHADDAVTLPLGYGREGAERIASGVGFNANKIRPADAPWICGGLQAHKTGRSLPLSRTQAHWQMHGRDIVMSATADEYAKEPNFTAEHKGPLPTLLHPPERTGEQWAMGIDLGVCTGCSACVLACQAENNSLIVGKESVGVAREMQWLRIDDYYEGPPEDPVVHHQPMMCQHCEKAPCEYVCPVNATVHSPDGLNEMVYNRCVGTRFCSNNCPYKVRRFNYLDFKLEQPANQGLVSLQRNPNVTVRDRGVMEKCTYCVQRIRGADIRARLEGRPIRTGEVVTACQQACPTGAITFDSLTHEDSQVVKWRNMPRNYAVLHETGAQPRTQYLARIRNPNPELL